MFRQPRAFFFRRRAMEPRRAARALADADDSHGKQRRRQARARRSIRATPPSAHRKGHERGRGTPPTETTPPRMPTPPRKPTPPRRVRTGGASRSAASSATRWAPLTRTRKRTRRRRQLMSGRASLPRRFSWGGARIARGRRASGGGGLNLSGSTFAAPAPADSTRATSSRRNFAGYRLRPTRASPPRRDAEPPRVRLSQTRSGRRRGSTRERGAGLEARGEEDEDASANPGGHRLSDALDESSFSADDSTVSDVPATASRTTNARVGSATGRGTGKGFAMRVRRTWVRSSRERCGTSRIRTRRAAIGRGFSGVEAGAGATTTRAIASTSEGQ